MRLRCMMLEVGNLFPDVSYRSYDGTIKDLYAQIGQNPAAILFLRYVGCTKCQLDIHELLSHQKEIAEKGVQVFVVFQSAPSTVRESLTDFPFEIICDPIQALYKRFDVLPAQTKEEFLDVEHFAKAHEAFQEKKRTLGLVHGAYEGNELQRPAIFLLDASKRIVYLHYAASLMDMPSVESWLQMV